MAADTDWVVLIRGRGDPERGEICLMQLTAILGGEPPEPIDGLPTDVPTTACPILTAFAISLNDSVDELQRQELKPFAQLLLGTYDANSAASRSAVLKKAVLAAQAEANAFGIPVQRAEVAHLLQACWESGAVELMRRLAKQFLAALHEAIFKGQHHQTGTPDLAEARDKQQRPSCECQRVIEEKTLA